MTSATCPDLARGLETVPDLYVVILYAGDEELARRYERTPDQWFSLEVVQAADQRFRTLASVLPPSVPRPHIDTCRTLAGEAYEQVCVFIAGEERG